MPEYRRSYLPGGTFFFTLVTYERQTLFSDPSNVQRLRKAIGDVKAQWPFEFVAGVVLPDHAHFIWTLPAGDADYSRRIGRVKVLFTRSLRGTRWAEPARASNTDSRQRHAESDIWQRRFWEHTIRDERDLEHHFDYVHYNPVKHGLCRCPHAWAASSFEHWVKGNVYERNWCCCCSDHEDAMVGSAHPTGCCSDHEVIRPYPKDLDGSVGE